MDLRKVLIVFVLFGMGCSDSNDPTKGRKQNGVSGKPTVTLRVTASVPSKVVEPTLHLLDSNTGVARSGDFVCTLQIDAGSYIYKVFGDEMRFFASDGSLGEKFTRVMPSDPGTGTIYARWKRPDYTENGRRYSSILRITRDLFIVESDCWPAN